MKTKMIHPYMLLLLGALFMTFSHLSFKIDLLAWISMVPFLVFLQTQSGWKSRLAFAATLFVTWTLIVAKIITPPIPWGLIFLYSLPITVIHLPGYLTWSWIRNYRWRILVFPAIMVVFEWAQYTFTPLASWGAAAYTQTESITTMQFVSLFGMPGLSFVIYWVNAALADLYLNKKKSALNVTLPFILVLFIIGYGAVRTNVDQMRGSESITVAAVGTDSNIGGPELPSNAQNVEDILNVLERTEKAANAGAQMVVWNEASFVLKNQDEAYWLDNFKSLARKKQISICASYVLLLSQQPMSYENKFVLIDDNGKILNTYLKHEPVPGEPAVKGDDPLKVFNMYGSKWGGAICYDYDFPYLARENAAAGADIVLLPSSDWRGIDPLHTRMAGFRAIEQGHSIIRSTRYGLSAAISPYGDIKSKMSHFDSEEKIMLASVPKSGITTVYSLIGDLLVYFCLAFIALTGIILLARKQTYAA